jgi:hypothetical protein
MVVAVAVGAGVPGETLALFTLPTAIETPNGIAADMLSALRVPEVVTSGSFTGPAAVTPVVVDAAIADFAVTMLFF